MGKFIDIPSFKYVICPDPADCILQAVRGEAVAVHSQNAIDVETCQAIFDAYKASGQTVDRKDGVGGSILGASHYGVSPDEYVNACPKNSTEIDRILSGMGQNIVTDLFKRIGEKIAQNPDLGIRTVRPLMHKGCPAANARLMMWRSIPGDEALVLQHHEDASQIRIPANDNSEFVKIDPRQVVAVIAYPHVEPSRGALHIYNFRPTPQERMALGVGELGFPYPATCVTGREEIVVPVATGDIVAIRGAYLHAVYSGNQPTKDRLIVNIFMAMIDSDLVYWT